MENRRITVVYAYFVSIFYLLFFETFSVCDSSVCECLAGQCTGCISQYFSYHQTLMKCTPCPSNCRTCSQNGICSLCSEGFFLDSQTSFCEQCSIRFCSKCNQQNSCQKCIDGYTLSSNLQQTLCVACAVLNAQTCSSQITVATCQSGYWKNGDSCSPCRQFCELCTSSTNCLKCQDGFRSVISAGTYCSACPTGCLECSASSCQTCFKNYRLSSGSCISIQEQCQNISNCDTCSYTNSLVSCKQCKYPYYLLESQCVIGSSLLCLNGSIGPYPNNCINSCGITSNEIQTLQNDQILCKPVYWIKSTDIIQYFYDSYSSNKSWKDFPFEDYENQLISCQQLSQLAFFSNPNFQLRSILRFKKNFPPYYKLNFKIKAFPTYKLLSSQLQMSLNIQMSDNSTNHYEFEINALTQQSSDSCRSIYFQFQSKIIKDQQVTIDFQAAILQNSNIQGYKSSDFERGLVAFSEVLIEVYRCSSQCRICSNSKYCLQCYGQLFLYENKCTSQCFGLFQFYAPNGDYNSYQYKQCLEQCPSGFYSDLSTIKEEVYMCYQCQNNCKTCKSSSQCLSCNQPLLYYDLGFNCIEQCPLTHYNLSSICTPCKSPCKTCISQQLCLTCAIGYLNPENNKCISQCQIGTFANTTSKVCQNCSQKCIQCSVTADMCSQCHSPYLLLQRQCVQECPIKTHYEQNNMCNLCKIPCFQCISQTQCLSCTIGYLLNSTCFEICPSGYYRNLTQGICSPCLQQCQQCISLTNCRSCIDNYYLFGSSCINQCPQNTYASNETNLCLPCIQPCLACIDSTYCLSCQVGYLSQIQPGTCLISCQDGYFQVIDQLQKSCVLCSQQCQTCSSEQYCLKCKNQTRFLFNGECLDQCPDGYYQLNSQCQSCAFPCQTCQQSPQKCLSCSSPYLFFNNKCISQCSITFYQQSGECFPCIYPCKSCSSADKCTTCRQQAENNNQTYLYEQKCLEQCPEGYFPDQYTYKCRMCNYPCQTCIDTKTCITCQSGYLTPDMKCEICPPNYYANKSSGICQLCSEAINFCDVCFTSQKCRYCQIGYYLFTENNITRCITSNQCQNKLNFYINEQQMSCSKCMLPCGECITLSKCQTCLTGYLYMTKCLLQCPDGYYEQINSKTCQICNLEVCMTCSNSPVSCSSCNVTGQFPILKPSQRICIREQDCSEEYYIDSSYGYQRCLKCQPPCLQCLAARVCLSCISGILHQNQCRSSCPLTYFEFINPNSSITLCSICSEPCLNCRQKADYCTSCIDSYYLQQNSCVTQCDSGFYLQENTIQCKKCQSPCEQCLSLQNCLTCDDQDLILYFGQCIQSCPDGTFKNITNKNCEQCPNQCQLCKIQSDYVICQKCNNQFYMSSTQQGKCIQSCKIQQYPDNYTRQCHACQDPCKQCISGIKCKTCVENFLLYKQQCLKGPECPENTFLSPNQKQCLDKCTQQQYFGQSLTKKCVKQCSFNYVKNINQKICVPQCPQSYYLAESKICLACQSDSCQNLLTMQLNAKSIFNVLYLRIVFSQEVQLSVLDTVLMSVEYKKLYENDKRRLLVQKTGEIEFQINDGASVNTLWLKAYPQESLSQVQLKICFSSHYIFPGKILQQINQTTILKSYDQYSSQQIHQGYNYEEYAKIVSIILCICLLVNIVFNTGYLTYSMLDYYQFLFILLYINTDYPPALNYFLYGFRYAHYLFLPQIFETNTVINTTSNTPQKFGIIVSDASFLSNTGHDFLIIFVVVGALIFFKILQTILNYCYRNSKSNRVKNSEQSQNRQGQHQIPQKASCSSQEVSQVEENNKTKSVINVVKNIINRFKYNYFNDFLYLIYFYMVMFAFAQTYNLQPGENAQYASIIFAILFMILGTVWPIVLAIGIFMKSRDEEIFIAQKTVIKSETNQQNIKKQSKLMNSMQNKQIYNLNPSYQCFYADIYKSYDNKVGLYLPVLYYLRKYLLAVVFVFSSSYPNFIMGIVISMSILLIIIKAIYRPYNNKIPFIISLISESLFILGCIFLTFGIVTGNKSLVEDPNLRVSIKIQYSKVCIAFFIILSILLAIYNLVMIALIILKKIGKPDYYSRFNQLEIISTLQEQGIPVYAKSLTSESQINNNAVQESNMRLQIVSQGFNSDLKAFKSNIQSQESQSQYSDGLGIHLIKNSQSPQLLIKCIKGETDNLRQQYEQPQQEQEDSQSSQNQNRADDIQNQSDLSESKQSSEKNENNRLKQKPQIFQVNQEFD